MPQTDGELVVTGDLTLRFTVKMATGLPTIIISDQACTMVGTRQCLLPGRNRALSGACGIFYFFQAPCEHCSPHLSKKNCLCEHVQSCGVRIIHLLLIIHLSMWSAMVKHASMCRFFVGGVERNRGGGEVLHWYLFVDSCSGCGLSCGIISAWHSVVAA